MALNAKTVAGGNTKYDQMEAGTYPTRLVLVADLGVQTQRPYKGEEKAPAQEIALTYEFVDEFLKDADGQEQRDKPRWLTETMPFYNLGADKAKSTARYLAFDPTQACEGEWPKLLGASAMVTVVLNPNNKKPGNFWENIADVMPMRARDVEKCAPLVNEAHYFDFDDPDMETFLKLPKFIQTKVKGALNYPKSKLAEMLGADGPAKEAEPVAEAAEAAEDEDQNPY